MRSPNGFGGAFAAEGSKSADNPATNPTGGFPWMIPMLHRSVFGAVTGSTRRCGAVGSYVVLVCCSFLTLIPLPARAGLLVASNSPDDVFSYNANGGANSAMSEAMLAICQLIPSQAPRTNPATTTIAMAAS